VYELSEYRWYKDGPDIAPPQEPVRVVPKAVLGTNASTVYPAHLPPQVAVSVTEQTPSSRHWGRFYLPAPAIWKAGDAVATPVLTTTGRFHSDFLTNYANAVDTFYEACRTGSIPIVVYSKAKPERETAAGTTLPAQAAMAIEVNQTQIDDVPDVLRSRRFSDPTLKVQRAVGP